MMIRCDSVAELPVGPASLLDGVLDTFWPDDIGSNLYASGICVKIDGKPVQVMLKLGTFIEMLSQIPRPHAL